MGVFQAIHMELWASGALLNRDEMPWTWKDGDSHHFMTVWFVDLSLETFVHVCVHVRVGPHKEGA